MGDPTIYQPSRVHLSVGGRQTTLDRVFTFEHDGRHYWLASVRSGKRGRLYVACGWARVSYDRSNMRWVPETRIPKPVLSAFRAWEAAHRPPGKTKPR